MHLVFPRCEVVFVELFCKKSASHPSVHVELLLLLFDTNFVGCCYNDHLVLHEHKIRHNTHEGDGLGKDVKNCGDVVQWRDVCKCV